MLHFNQRINDQEILKVTKIHGGGSDLPFRLAAAEELNQDKTLAKQTAQFGAGTFVVIKPESALPPNSSIQVTVGPGIPSAEGPLLTKGIAKFGFSTYGPMELRPPQTWQKQTYSAGPFVIGFTNPIDSKGFKDSFVKVTPPVTELHTSITRDYLYINCQKKARTSYKVELSDQIKDVFGQHLSANKVVTIKTLPELPQMNVPISMIVLPRKQSTMLPISTVNLPSFKMSVYGVSPAQHPKYPNYNDPVPAGAKLLATKTLLPKGRPDEPTNVDIDLKPWLKESNHLFIHCTSAVGRDQKFESSTWVQCTNIGIDAFQDTNQVLVWATDIISGAPIAGAEVSILPGNTKARTDQSGLAKLPLEKDGDQVCVQTGHDSAFVFRPWGSFSAQSDASHLRWYAVSDRAPYKPGEKVQIKGVIRSFRNTPTAELEDVKGVVESIKFTVTDSVRAKLLEGKTDINPYGGFDLSFDVPKNANLGSLAVVCEAKTKVKVDGGSFLYSVPLLEFRRPEFEVTLKNEGEPAQMIGASALYSAHAAYLATGAVKHSQINWSASAFQSSYSPPGWSEYSFGREPEMFSFFPTRRYVEPANQVRQLSGTTDSSGNHYVKLNFLSVRPAEPSSVQLQATVQDVNRQTFSSTTTLLAHPSSLYVGLKKEKFFARKDETLPLSLVVTDIDGKFQPGVSVKVEMYHPTYGPDDAEKEIKNDLQELTLTTTATGEKPCKFELHGKQGGSYTIHATVSDAQHRVNESSANVWIEGGEAPRSENVETKQLILLAEKASYKPGETASILIQAPFAPAEGLATIWHNGLAQEIRFHAEDKSYTLKIPLRALDVPDEIVEVDMVGNEKHKSGRTIPAEASGSVTLKISPEAYRLTVEAEPSVEKTEPGKEVSVDVLVKDNNGDLVPDAEVTLAVVDDSLLSLTGYKFGDPMTSFYRSTSGFQDIFRIRPLCLVQTAAAEEEKRNQSSKNASPMMAAPRLSGATNGTIAGDAFAGAGGMQAEFSKAPAQMAALPPPAGLVPSAPARGEANNRGPQGQDATYVTGVNTAGPVPMPVIAMQARSNFDALANWTPSKLTDKAGHAVIKFSLPDNITRYRIMAFAHSGPKRFGTGESSLVVRMPLTVRPSAPRFLNFGDKFELPFVVQNQTDRPLSVRLAARGTNIKFTAGQGRQFTVPANDRVEVRLPASTEESGTVHVQAIAASGEPRVASAGTAATGIEATTVGGTKGGASNEGAAANTAADAGSSPLTKGAAPPFAMANEKPATPASSAPWVVGSARDAADFSIPVQLPATTEAFATYGEIDQGSVMQKVLAPDNILPDYGSLELTTSSTALETLTDAFIYLNHYPFECSEQISSRLISIALLKDMLAAFHAAGLPSADQIQETVKQDLDKLTSRQEANGAFCLWHAGDRQTYPYVTLHVMHAILRLKAAGYDVPPPIIDRGMSYVRHIDTYLDSTYSPASKLELRAFALYLRDLVKEKVAPEAARLLGTTELEKISPEVLAYLWPTFVHGQEERSLGASNRIRQYFNNYIVETSSTAQFVRANSPSDYRLFYSGKREEALVVDAMIIAGEDDHLVVKLLKSLLGGRKQGRWSNTQENAYVLLAMRHYFDKYEHVTPNFVANAWLGHEFVGEHSFKGRTNEFKMTTIPLPFVLAHKPADQAGSDFILEKKGEGRLYYRLGMSYAPKDLRLKPMNRGFSVERTYEGVKNKEDVRRDSDGVWHFKSGSLVRTKLKVSALSDRFFVAFVDPMPAGTEALDPALSNTEKIADNDDNNQAQSPNSWWSRWWRWNWWTHENVRDNQIEVFADQLSGGSHEYSHLTRATTPGTFVVPPAKAEEMYAPETFGRTNTEIVVVE
jgi:uncharacterized protein YfaS (alpha-2-macroglobulin family)